MTKRNRDDAATEIERLRDEIRRHERLYYVDASPEISDYDFDQLMRQLQELELEHPELRSDDSPTVRVGGAPIEEFITVIHDPPMLSIENAYSFEELAEWDARVRKGAGVESVEYIADVKIDGVSIDLLYENGALVRGATRGDGVRGDDVTPNVRTVRALPLRIPHGGTVEVRGEIYLEKAQFLKLVNAAEEEGDVPPANPRNAAAGSLRLKKSTEAAKRRLSAFVYQLVRAGDEKFATQAKTYDALAKLGFPVNPVRQICRTFDELREFVDSWRTKRHDLPFEIDGMVVKVNRRDLQQELGATSKFPRWAIAFKYPPEAATTVIRQITFQVGRTGAITPVANFDDVKLGGTTVKRATLHNFDEVARKDIRVGDTVHVEKGGDVIPKVTGVVLEKRPSDSRPLELPVECPECHAAIHRFEGEVALRCVNPGCPAIVKESILHWGGRKAMDIEGLGEESVQQFIEQGLVRDFTSIYELKRDDLVKLERWGEVKAENLLSQIERSKSAELTRVIFALGIRFVGERAAKLLANAFESLDNLMAADFDRLVAIPEIGPKVAESVLFYFSLPENRERIEKLKRLGLLPTFQRVTTGNRLEGKTIVVTGTLTRFTRDEIHLAIEREGGKPSGSVSKKTSFLIAGEEAGSKLEKARALGVPVLSENEFIEMLGM